MYNTSTNEIISILIQLFIVIVFFLLSALFIKLKPAFFLMFSRKNTVKNNSLIFSYYSDSFDDLYNFKYSKFKDIYYSLWNTINPNNPTITNTPNKKSIIICVLYLPFNTQTHIIGLSKRFDINKVLLENYMLVNDMEEIKLEGDFVDKYIIYANRGQGAVTQYVIDPQTMEFIEDYCQDNFWEIANDEMHIVCDKNQENITDFIKDGLEFARQIRPALGIGTDKDLSINYGEYYETYRTEPLLCPICNAAMAVTAHWLECPNHDGILINGHYLVEIHNEEIAPPITSDKPKKHGPLQCPNCHNQLQQVNYQNGGIIIDSCPNCPFRWLDDGEATKIIAKGDIF